MSKFKVGDLKFPELLKFALIKKKRVHVLAHEVTDENLVEYMQWKAASKIDVLTPAKLRILHRDGQYSREIFKIFKNSNKISFLEKEFTRRSKVS